MLETDEMDNTAPTYEHFFGGSRKAMDKLATALQEQGVIVPNPPYSPVEGSTDWWLVGYTTYTGHTDIDAWSAWTAELDQLAVKHGGYYDGGGMFVGSLPAAASS